MSTLPSPTRDFSGPTLQAELKEKGIDEVLVICVNDGAVMQAWAADQKVTSE